MKTNAAYVATVHKLCAWRELRCAREARMAGNRRAAASLLAAAARFRASFAHVA